MSAGGSGLRGRLDPFEAAGRDAVDACDEAAGTNMDACDRRACDRRACEAVGPPRCGWEAVPCEAVGPPRCDRHACQYAAADDRRALQALAKAARYASRSMSPSVVEEPPSCPDCPEEMCTPVPQHALHLEMCHMAAERYGYGYASGLAGRSLR